jgi:hypothetical protein
MDPSLFDKSLYFIFLFLCLRGLVAELFQPSYFSTLTLLISLFSLPDILNTFINASDLLTGCYHGLVIFLNALDQTDLC